VSRHRLDRLIDERHAALLGQTVQLFRGAGWEVDVEVSFSIFGERGSLDVLGGTSRPHASPWWR